MELWWQVSGSGNWMSSGLLSGTLEGYYIGPCVSGAIYDVQIRAIRSGGAYSSWVEVAGYTCQSQVSTDRLAERHLQRRRDCCFAATGSGWR